MGKEKSIFRQATAIIIGSICWAVPALANTNIEFRPPSQTVRPTIRVRLSEETTNNVTVIGRSDTIGMSGVRDGDRHSALAEPQTRETTNERWSSR